MRDYLIASFGFSPSKAATASKPIAHLASPEKPDSVRHFLKHQGFNDAYIRKFVSGYPSILCADVDQTLGPSIRALRQLGFTEDKLQKLVAHNPRALVLRSVIPRIEFWKVFFKSDTQKLFLALTRNCCLINLDVDKNVVAKMSLLKDYGLSGTQIDKLIVQGCGVFLRGNASMEVLLKRVQELGFPHGSSYFLFDLSALGGVSTNLFKSKMELFKGFGWTEVEFITAFNKAPVIIKLSKETIGKKMEFLVDKAGCTPSYIAFRPSLLTCSLEKRLMPRLRIVEILKDNELVSKKLNLFSIMTYPEKTFTEKFVLPFKNKVPNIHIVKTVTDFASNVIK